MATFKAEVYAHQKKQDGTYNIKIRVTQNQKKRYLATTWYVTKDDLTRSLKLKNQKYIDLTDQLIRKYRNICDGLGERLKTLTVDEVVYHITNYKQEKFDLDIVQYAREMISEMRNTGHNGNARTYECAINNLVKFVGREKISIFEITVGFLNRWIQAIKDQDNLTTGYAPHNYISRLRSVHNKAKKQYNDEDAGIIRIPNSPFSHIEIPKLPPVRKRALSTEQVRAIAELGYRKQYQAGTNRFNLSRDVFLISFCLVGMNAVDLYNADNCKDGRITYERTKTHNRRDDHARISIKIEPEIQPLIDKYRDPSGKRVFRFYKMYSSMDTFYAALNKGLKLVGRALGEKLKEDDLEFYAARHSWATIAANKAGVDKYTVHLALNHVDDVMRITDRYIDKDWEPIDNANRKVLDYMNLDLSNVDEP